MEYPRGSGAGLGAGVIGGVVGSTGSLAGLYIFGDVTGDIYTAPVSSLRIGSTLDRASIERRNLDFTPDVGTIDRLAVIAQDANGNVYLLDIAGNIFRVDVTP